MSLENVSLFSLLKIWYNLRTRSFHSQWANSRACFYMHLVFE